MAQVGVVINGRTYQIACDDGQEDHLRHLAGYVDKRVAELAAAVGQVGDLRLLVMTSLILADEASEMAEGLAAADETGPGAAVERTEAQLAADLDLVAERLERLADRLERAS